MASDTSPPHETRAQNEMLETMKTPDKLMRTDAANSELRVGEVVYNPAPDADERIRRLITLLIKVSANHRPAVPASGSHTKDHSEVEARCMSRGV